MDDSQKIAVMEAALSKLIRDKGIISPNSDNLDLFLYRFMSCPEFKGKGITLNQAREVYCELCQKTIVARAQNDSKHQN